MLWRPKIYQPSHKKPRYDDMMYHQLVNTISKAQSAGLLNKSFLTGLMRGLSQNQEVTLHKGAPSLDAMLHNSGVVSPYGPTLEHVNKARELFEQHNMGTRTYSDDNPAIRPGVITKTDGFNVDDILYKISKNLSNVTKQLQSEPKNPELIKQYEYASAMLEGAMAQNDLTQQSYDVMSESPNSLMNWYPAIATTLDEQNEPAFKTPKTMAIRPTIEYAQFMRHNVLYASERDLQVFNDYLVEELGLVEGKTYFIKLGNYSNKFNFENCICDDIAQIAKQILIINAQAMDKRAATTIDIVAREFIPNDDLPTIYNGMPLRTEFRAFVNFTTGELYGTVPYWNSDYVEQVLDMTFKGATQYDSEFIADQMQHDLNTFRRHRYNIDKDFNESINYVNDEIFRFVQEVHNNQYLSGQWSVDVMKDGDNYYIIDLALMNQSALIDLLPKYPYIPNK